DWASGEGGEWQNWWVDNGELFMVSGEPLSLAELETEEISIYPNPTSEFLNLPFELTSRDRFQVFNVQGQVAKSGNFSKGSKMGVTDLPEGFYLLRITKADRILTSRFVKTN
ncbi:MAG TPA: T9SS type A sorting domain-containing protein, partial [Cryomorphaceae bacterium]|nr:T9SS type A sorting domain-containing protein [Cryomorphaceae bacterium]